MNEESVKIYTRNHLIEVLATKKLQKPSEQHIPCSEQKPYSISSVTLFLFAEYNIITFDIQ